MEGTTTATNIAVALREIARGCELVADAIDKGGATDDLTIAEMEEAATVVAERLRSLRSPSSAFATEVASP